MSIVERVDRATELANLALRSGKCPSADLNMPAITRMAGRLCCGDGRPSRAHASLLPQSNEQILSFAAVADSHCTRKAPACVSCPLRSQCAFAARSGYSPRTPYAIDLFAGAGGFSLGLKHAGLPVYSAVEIDRNAAQTYRFNHAEVKMIEADISTVAGADLLPPSEARPLAIVAGPPCQGYSAAGSRNPGDPKNQLFAEVIRIARETKPRFVVIENVPGLRRVNGVQFSDLVCEALTDGGFPVDRPHLVKSEDFGVPQRRRRLMFIAQSAEHASSLLAPEPTHRTADSANRHLPLTPTVEQVFSTLPCVPAGTELEFGWHNDEPVFNASTMAHSDRVIRKISKIRPGEGPISYRRLDRSLARTLVAGHRALPVHPWLDRSISVREAARIQGFPDDFIFAGSRSNQPLQIANAVPVPLAEAVGRLLLGVADES